MFLNIKVKIFPIKHIESIENGKFKSARIIKIDLQDKDGKANIVKYRELTLLTRA